MNKLQQFSKPPEVQKAERSEGLRKVRRSKGQNTERSESRKAEGLLKGQKVEKSEGLKNDKKALEVRRSNVQTASLRIRRLNGQGELHKIRMYL